MSRNRQRRAAERLTFSYGLSKPLALQVVRGQLDLTEALRQDKQAKDIERLVGEHQLHHSLAVQISRGELDETEVLHKVYGKRMIEAHQSRSIWEDALNTNQPLLLHLHAQKTEEVTLSSVGQYDITTEAGEAISKLSIKLAHFAEHAIGFEQQEAAPSPPIERPEKRFRMSNSRLYALHIAERTLELSLLEGLVCKGRLLWFNQWELGLEHDNGPFSVFRHAVTQLK